MRARATVAVVTTTLVTLMATPAWAQPSFVTGQADTDVDADLTMRVPSQPDSGRTVGVTVAVPSAFAVLGCQAPLLGWECVTEGQRVVFTAGPTAAPVDTSTFTISVHTPATFGVHGFDTTQSFEGGGSTSFTSAAGTAPTVQVGQAPPEGDGEDDGTNGGSTDPGGDDGTGGTQDPPAGTGDDSTTTGGDAGDPSTPTPTDDAGTTGDEPDEAETDGSTGGAGPVTTRRSNGTSFTVTDSPPSGSSSTAGSSAIADPAVADALAGEPPTGDTMAAGDAGTGEESDGGLAPTQLTGLLLLLGGGVAIVVRRRMAAR